MADVTIYEIARMTGVSASTVSRVINKKPGVKKATEKRVLECLEEHHYTPNEAARGLVNQSSRMIGILISDMRTSHHTEGIAYIQQELSELGYCCLIMNTGHEEKEKARYIQMLNHRRVEAAILIGSTFESDVVKAAIAEYLPKAPVILANGYIDLPNVYGIIADERNGVYECVKLLANKKRWHLAFAIDNETPSNRLKLEGFCAGVRELLSDEAPRVVYTGNDFDGIYRAVAELMQTYPDTDGIVFAEDQLAAIGLRALRDAQISVPQQVGVIGINNSLTARICIPSLTSLDNMLLDLSVTAARNLIDVLNGKHVVRKMMIYSHIVEREST